MNISHFFELLHYLIVIALTRHFKGHMKILASSLHHKHHYPESQYQHSISNGIGLQKFHFFLTIFYPSIPRHPFVFKTNRCLNFRKHQSISVWKKIATPNIFGNFPVKHTCWSPFQVHFGASEKALQSSYSAQNLYTPASVKRNSTAHVTSGIFQSFRNMQE